MSTVVETRRIPPLGGFSMRFVRLELRRLLRNRRAVIFTLIMPSAFFLIFGTGGNYKHDFSVGPHTNVTAYIMVSMAVYGAMIAVTSGGAMVSTERALGWSRQLRLTPLHPVAYIATKGFVAMSMGAVAIVMVSIVGLITGAKIPVHTLIFCDVLGWICTLVFAAFGLFMGYLLPSENVMQVLGPALAVMSFAGGLFAPLSSFSHTFQVIAKFIPVYGVGVIARYPIGQEGNIGIALFNVFAWTAVFALGAAWRMSRDTARV